MKELTNNEIAMVSGGMLPILLGYYLYMGSNIAGVYAMAKSMS